MPSSVPETRTDQGVEPNDGWMRPHKTVCGRSDLAYECRRAPIPDVELLLGRLSAVPRNLTFRGGTRRRFTDSATQSGQRLLPRAATGHCRPKPARRVAPKQPDGEPSLFSFGFYEAAVRGLTDPATSGTSGWARKSCPAAPANGRSPAMNLKLPLARPGHQESFGAVSFPANQCDLHCSSGVAMISSSAPVRWRWRPPLPDRSSPAGHNQTEPKS